MFWYGEGNLNPKMDWTKKDWRPEIHDSDGLAIRTGAGERIWRPVNNPMRPQVNSFSDTSLQRSEEHTSELQSLMRISYAVFCLKKKKQNDRKKIYKY